MKVPLLEFKSRTNIFPEPSKITSQWMAEIDESCSIIEQALDGILP